LGWTVLRFWGKYILKNVDKCIEEIEDTIYDLKVEYLENNCDYYNEDRFNDDI
jgi:DNA mismatch endonuclease (patch repair protein)